MSGPAEETRVVLVKPGDVLVFGNVGTLGDLVDARDQLTEMLARLHEFIGVRVVVFAGDIDMAAVPGAGHGREGG